MKRDCFYKLTITKQRPIKGDYYLGKKKDVWYLGRFTHKEVMREVREWYKRGADAVELEMITQEQFDARMPSPDTDEK